MKKLITGILLALCLLAAAGCGGTRDTGEKYVAYEIGHVTIMQNAPNGYAFTVEAEGADSIRISRTDRAEDGQAVTFEQQGTDCSFSCTLAEGDYFLFVGSGEKTAMLPFTIPKMQPSVQLSERALQLSFGVDGATSWSSFIDPNGKSVYKSAKNVFDDTAVLVREGMAITADSVSDREYDASMPYYYVVFEGKNGKMTYIGSAVSALETEFSSLSASLSVQAGAAVLTVTGLSQNAGYVPGVHSASGELVLGTQGGQAGEFSVACDLTAMTEAGIWYDVRLYNLATGQSFDLPSSCADLSTALTAGSREYSFQEYEGLLKVTFSQQRGDLADALTSPSFTLSAQEDAPCLTLTAKAEAGRQVTLEIRKDGLAAVAVSAASDGTVSLTADLSSLNAKGNWYDIIVTVDGTEYDVRTATAAYDGQLALGGHVYAFREWEGVLKIAYDPTE